MTVMKLSTHKKLILARWLYLYITFLRRLAIRSPRIQVRRNQIFWNLDVSQAIDLSIYLTGKFEARTLKDILRCISRASIVIDIGANIGAHTLPIAKVLDKGLVIACEPTEWAFNRLNANIELNPLLQSRVNAIQCGLTAVEGQKIESDIYSSWPLNTAGHPIHGGVANTTFGAESITLDLLVERLKLPHIELVKIDVDGHEYSVLEGSRASINKFHPYLVMEWSPQQIQEFGHQPSDLRALLENLGYEPIKFKRSKIVKIHWNDLELIPYGSSQNVVFRHSTDFDIPQTK